MVVVVVVVAAAAAAVVAVVKMLTFLLNVFVGMLKCWQEQNCPLEFLNMCTYM